MTAIAEPWSAVRARMPHRGIALLLTGIERSEPGFVAATAVVPASYPLVDGEGAPSFLGLELGAQAAAVMDALRAPDSAEPTGAEPGDEEGAPPGAGYLVRVREATFLVAHLPVDAPLCVTARLEGVALPLTVHRISVSAGGVELVRALLGLHRGAPSSPNPRGPAR